MKEMLFTIAVIVILGVAACMYLKKSIQSDFALIYDTENSVNREQVGWHTLTTDLFRAPREPQALSILVGVGAQVLASVIAAFLCVTLFFSSSNFRPHIFVISLILLACFGFCNGFAASRLIKLFKAGDWKASGLLASVVFPSYVLFMYGISDIIELRAKSSIGVSTVDAFKYSFFWLMIDVPLTLYGAWIGYNKPLDIDPVVSEADKEIPPQPLYMHSWITVPVLGSIPFLSVIVLIKYMMDSIWRNNLIFAMFGMLYLHIVLMILIIALVICGSGISTC